MEFFQIRGSFLTKECKVLQVFDSADFLCFFLETHVKGFDACILRAIFVLRFRGVLVKAIMGCATIKNGQYLTAVKRGEEPGLC